MNKEISRFPNEDNQIEQLMPRGTEPTKEKTERTDVKNAEAELLLDDDKDKKTQENLIKKIQGLQEYCRRS